MKELAASISQGLYKANIDKLIAELRRQRTENSVAWFCLLNVLENIDEEWDGDVLPFDRAKEIDRVLVPIVQRFLTTTLHETPANAQADLEKLVTAYLSLYPSK